MYAKHKLFANLHDSFFCLFQPMTAVQGYETFRANMMKRLNNIKTPAEPNSSTLEHPKKQPQQPNSWTNDSNKSDLVGAIGGETVPLNDLLQTSPSSPKPFTAVPPTELHKPLAKTPVSSTNSIADDANTQNNYDYENHADLETAMQGETIDAITQPKVNDKPSITLSSMLKKIEEANAQNTSDSRSSNESHKENIQPKSNTQTSSTFSKLRNTSSSNQPSNSSSTKTKLSTQLNATSDHSEHSSLPVTVSNRDKHSLPSAYVPPHIPLRVTVNDVEISPYETSLGRENTRHAPYRVDQRYATHTGGESRYATHTGGTSVRDFRGRYEVGRSPATSSGKPRQGSNASTEYAGLYHTPPFEASNVDKDGYSSPTMLRQQFASKGDINNNTTSKPETGQMDNSVITRGAPGRTRIPLILDSSANRLSDLYTQTETDQSSQHVQKRLPLVLDSSINRISDLYPQSEKDQNSQTVQKHVDFDLRPEVFQPEIQNDVEEAIVATGAIVNHTPVKIPSYNAKRVHNYENQGRLEKPAPAVRHRADPVFMTPAQSQRHLSHNPTDTYPKAARHGLINRPQTGSLQNTPVKDTNILNDRYHTLQDNSFNSRPARDPPSKPSRNLNMQFQESLKNDESKYKSPTLANVNPLSSLISRFEKKPGSHLAVDTKTHDLKHTHVHSTPNSNILQSGSDDIAPPIPPPPIPPRADQSFADNYPTDSLESRSSRGKHARSQHNMQKQVNTSLHDLPSPTDVSLSGQSGKTLVATPIKSLHVREDTGLSDQGESYKDRLRKVAANSSVLDRSKSKQFTPQYPKPNSNVQFSTPQYGRQNSNPQSASTYSRQSSMNQSQQSSYLRQNGFIPQAHAIGVPNHIDQQIHSKPNNISTNQIQTNNEVYSPKVNNITNAHLNNMASPTLPQKNSPFTNTEHAPHVNNNHFPATTKTNTDQYCSRSNTTAIVNPMVRHQGSITYMDI